MPAAFSVDLHDGAWDGEALKCDLLVDRRAEHVLSEGLFARVAPAPHYELRQRAIGGERQHHLVLAWTHVKGGGGPIGVDFRPGDVGAQRRRGGAEQ
jgi:hypothetical protein